MGGSKSVDDFDTAGPLEVRKSPSSASKSAWGVNDVEGTGAGVLVEEGIPFGLSVILVRLETELV